MANNITLSDSVTAIMAPVKHSRHIAFPLLLLLWLHTVTDSAQARTAPRPISNYLLSAYERTLEMQYKFEVSLTYYGQYLNAEAGLLSTALLDRVADRLDTATADAQGQPIRDCILAVSGNSLMLIWNVNEVLQTVKRESILFHHRVIQSLATFNVLTGDPDAFWDEFEQQLNAKFEHINNNLLQIVIDQLYALIAARTEYAGYLEWCLGNVA